MALAQVYQLPPPKAMPKAAPARRPSFQFYPADWRKDPALAACSLAARALWLEMMCIAHESDNYGCLTINGQPMTTAHIARVVGESATTVKKLLAELENFGVFSRKNDGAIYSRRMVRDEEIRNARAAFGHKGAAHGHKGAEHGHKGAEHGIKGKAFGNQGAQYGAMGGRPKKTTADRAENSETPPPHTTPHAVTETGGKNPKPPRPPSSSSSSSPSGSSVANATAAQTPQAAPVSDKPPPTPEELAKQELWRSAVSLLRGQGIDEQQTRSLMGKLVKDHGTDAVLDVVRQAVAEQPADARAWMLAAVKGKGKRTPKAEDFESKNYGQAGGYDL